LTERSANPKKNTVNTRVKAMLEALRSGIGRQQEGDKTTDPTQGH